MWTLRKGSRRDVHAMHALDLLCFNEPFQFDADSIRSFVEQRGAISLVAVADGVLAGFVIVHRRRGQGYVVTLDVAPLQRRSGLARALMSAAEAQVRIMDLHVYVDNRPALAFYEKHGYRRVAIVPGFYGVGLDAWVCRKNCQTLQTGGEASRDSVASQPTRMEDAVKEME